MEDSYLRKHVNEATQQLLFLLNNPQDAGIYATIQKQIEKIKLGTYKDESIFIETLTHYLVATSDFIQRIAYFHPGSAENTWFHKKIEHTLALFEELGDAVSVQKKELPTQISAQIIHNMVDLEELEINLLLSRKRSLIKNKAQFFSIVDLLYTASHSSLPLDIGVPVLLENLCFALFQLRAEKTSVESVTDLWERLILLTNPLSTKEEKMKLALTAHKKAEAFQTYPTWYDKEVFTAEVAETNQIIQILEKSNDLHDVVDLLSDSFFLFQSFKQHYLPKTLPYVSFASFARSCLIAKNLAFALPVSQQQEHLKTLLEMARNLLCFLENRTTNSAEEEKMAHIQTACHLMSINYKTLIAAAESLKTHK